MFSIKSYILDIPKMEHTSDEIFKNEMHKFFIDVENCKELKRLEKTLDWWYLNGAIVLKYYDTPLLDFNKWDLVDQTWTYLVQMINELEEQQESFRTFPDMPVKLAMSNLNGSKNILFKVGMEKWILPKKEFVETIYLGAVHFFNSLLNCFGQSHPSYSDWEDDLDYICEMEEKYIQLKGKEK
ncbi:hypothetical protein SAMN05444487_107156 [Marininema mesophilum]|uniref:Uncharacterized protein n=1 Tax=Marininema mesophilum TaxID=1048340 RepID=A0A1H2XDD2_9BACL|nr:hypothetical protein [Marininema mesophilum]SDW90269.1 hypothetical protein SAMN05444487_107156 [Marininema mesophilum]